LQQPSVLAVVKHLTSGICWRRARMKWVLPPHCRKARNSEVGTNEPSEIFTMNKLVNMFKQTQNKFISDELAKVIEIKIYARCFHLYRDNMFSFSFFLKSLTS
jgi:hypothetical protein